MTLEVVEHAFLLDVIDSNKSEDEAKYVDHGSLTARHNLSKCHHVFSLISIIINMDDGESWPPPGVLGFWGFGVLGG